MSMSKIIQLRQLERDYGKINDALDVFCMREQVTAFDGNVVLNVCQSANVPFEKAASPVLQAWRAGSIIIHGPDGARLTASKKMVG